MASSNKVLLLEDDPNLGFILKEHLDMQKFDVVLCTNGIEGQNEYRRSKFILCLVDVMMPKKDGFTFVKELRQIDQRIPVIFLTAKSLKDDRIEGFKVGADDYITKPFSMEELLLRIKAVLKRTSNQNISGKLDQKIYKVGKFNFDYEHSSLSSSAKKKIKLTSKESELLKILCSNINSVVDRDTILEKVWGNNTVFTARSMDVYVSKLRKYLKDDPSVSISTIHGKGLKLIK